MKYKAGYKYQLAEKCRIKTSIRPGKEIKTKYASLDLLGNLTMEEGYASDGPSGPTIDTKTFMRGAFAHDALYEFMRKDLLSQKWRKEADKELRRICIEDGMNPIRAWWVYKGVRFGGLKSASAENRKEIIEVP
jgi:hypothetical protein